jgi:WD40 repeat protein
MGSDFRPGRHLTSSNNRAKNLKLLLCAMALGTLLASSASPQVLLGTILLPDSLGPLTGKTHVVFDENPEHPRMFIGSEDGDVLVLDAITCRRIARIPTGPVASICYSPQHNRLYTSTLNGYTVVISDCSSYQVVKVLPFTAFVSGLYYNPIVDRVYCGSYRMKVIDCTGDSVVGSLKIHSIGACFAFDSARNRLYIGAGDTFRVMDCDRDSVIASIHELRNAQAVCFQPTAAKVYVAAGESLFALSTESDTVVYRQGFDTLSPQLACDRVHNRVYYTYRNYAIALDCANDSVVWSKYLWARAMALAVVPALDKVHMVLTGLAMYYAYVLDGATGQTLCRPDVDIVPYYCERVNRVFYVIDGGHVSAIDCETDSVVKVTQLGSRVVSVCVDSIDDKLYLGTYSCGLGMADCATNTVRSYSDACMMPRTLLHVPLGNKLYCSGSYGIYVFDCATDTLIDSIPVSGRAVCMDWHPGLNKLYATVDVQVGEEDTFKLVVIDCLRDSILECPR